ncbi:MAG: DUF2975 domain-containing protein [Candidatus Pacebacteria bacterium]|nr:DUF2975 domain-containing protein [Candidatus Paceibacterota bacterium]
MHRVPTYFLRLVILALSLGVLALCIFGLPSILHGASAEFPYASRAVFLIVMGIYMTTIPFYIALWQMMRLLSNIDSNNAFSESSVQALRVIKYCAAAIAGFYMAFVPLLFPIADADDAPGLILIGFGIACAPVATAIFAAILQKLMQTGMELRSEVELTV